MPPNTLATHLNNIHYHGNVVHGPRFFPQGNVGFNVWSPSRPGMNHAWHINNLHNGRGWGLNGYPAWPSSRQYPTLLESALRNPNKYNVLPFQRHLLGNAEASLQAVYARMRSGPSGNIFQNAPQLASWQRYRGGSPATIHFARFTPPSAAEQLGLLRRRMPNQGPGQFPFAAGGGIDAPFDTALNGLPRSTLQRVGDAIGGLLGRRSSDPIAQAPGFPVAPRSTPTVRSFPGSAPIGPFNRNAPEGREHGEARSMLLALRDDIQTFITQHSPMLPATDRTLGVLVASIDASLNSPTLNRNHALSAQMFFQSIADMDARARADRNDGRTEEPAESPAETEV